MTGRTADALTGRKPIRIGIALPPVVAPTERHSR